MWGRKPPAQWLVMNESKRKKIYEDYVTKASKQWSAYNDETVLKALEEISNMECDEIDETYDNAYHKSNPNKKRGNVANGYTNVAVEVVANGYLVKVGGRPQDVFIFKNFDEITKWMKDQMHPTYKNAGFMEKL